MTSHPVRDAGGETGDPLEVVVRCDWCGEWTINRNCTVCGRGTVYPVRPAPLRAMGAA